jgi:hypothetical protein
MWSTISNTMSGETPHGYRPRESEPLITASILQALGVSAEEATRLARSTVPPYPELPVDFGFVLKVMEEHSYGKPASRP